MTPSLISLSFFHQRQDLVTLTHCCITEGGDCVPYAEWPSQMCCLGRGVMALKHRSDQPFPPSLVRMPPPPVLSAAGSKSPPLPQTNSSAHPSWLPRAQQRRHPVLHSRCSSAAHPVLSLFFHLSLLPLYPLPAVSMMGSFPPALPINVQPCSRLSQDYKSVHPNSPPAITLTLTAVGSALPSSPAQPTSWHQAHSAPKTVLTKVTMILFFF